MTRTEYDSNSEPWVGALRGTTPTKNCFIRSFPSFPPCFSYNGCYGNELSAILLPHVSSSQKVVVAKVIKQLVIYYNFLKYMHNFFQTYSPVRGLIILYTYF